MSTTHVHHREPSGQHRWMVPLALATAVTMLALWFPFSALWHQQKQIDQAEAALTAVRGEQNVLSTQSKDASSTTAQKDLARADYQLVSPGQSLIQVLPGRDTNGVWTRRDDPGFQPLARPDSAPVATTTASSGRAAHGFIQRLARTLEFWR